MQFTDTLLQINDTFLQSIARILHQIRVEVNFRLRDREHLVFSGLEFGQYGICHSPAYQIKIPVTLESEFVLSLFSDGLNDLIDISKICKISYKKVLFLVNNLRNAGLVE